MQAIKKHYRLILSFFGGVVSILLVFVFVQQLDWIKAHFSEFLTDKTVTALNNEETDNDHYLKEEEVVIIEVVSDDKTNESEEVVLPVTKTLFEYVGVINSCGPHYEGDCLNARSGPGTDFSVVNKLRNGMVLKVGGKVERDGDIWYKVVFDEWLRYPERESGEWYVSADYDEVLLDEGSKTVWDKNENEADQNGTGTTNKAEKSIQLTKKILVDRTHQKLYAYENGRLFMMSDISTGLELTPTPRGTFSVFKKTPTRYMQGPIPDVAEQYYDMPGVPWNLYFTHNGAVIHGAYWHNSFGSAYSHGCVNLPTYKARLLYNWADLNTEVVVTN